MRLAQILFPYKLIGVVEKKKNNNKIIKKIKIKMKQKEVLLIKIPQNFVCAVRDDKK